ncbi:TetR family transcriptional regulator [Aliiroseovarius subalbicans]|uniref:TetR family transcriptional regulator n=1 Tax=Aliiroseovarius subalbicans TaxID=2925840 RepID=UPI001F59CDDF|nr:TetR family transcriptional regulator [Aliiroseovarius subalbicans]MCI2399717.1 TetR/AcrR family transcriptional regulator [Aliiroseovarius subalbicans]
MPATKTRLNADNWLVAGLDALVKRGPDALKAEKLARDVGATKGSFYWHFKDLPDYHTRLVGLWEQRALVSLAGAGEEEADPVRRLDRLGSLSATNALEQAVRAWAQANSEMAAAIDRVEAHRLALTRATLGELHLTNPDFARIVLGAQIGMGTLSASDGQENDSAMSTLLAALLALRDA